MALSRANAVTYLTGQYGTGADSFLVLANIGLTDVSGGLKEIIDDAFLAAGVTFSALAGATIADTDVSDTLALLRFTALRKVYSSLNAPELRGDLKIGDIALSGLVDNVKDLLTLEFSDLKSRGLIAAGPSAAAFLGGHSVADSDARDLDTGITQPFFTRQTGNNPFGQRWSAPGVWR